MHHQHVPDDRLRTRKLDQLIDAQILTFALVVC
jgi:hypothetical protein